MTKIISVDLGGTHLRFAVVENGKISSYSKLDTQRTKKDILDQIVNGIENCREKGTNKVGIACAGIVENGKIIHSPNLPLDNTNLKKYIEKKCKLKTEVGNDANCAATAEAKYGSKKKNFIFLTLGTGVGGGIIINRELYKGNGPGGEIGHIILDKGKQFEELAASKGARKLIQKHYGIKNADNEKIKQVLNENSKKSEKIRNEISDYIGQGIASLTAIFDPEIIILAGGMSRLGNPFLKKIKSKTKKYLFMHKLPEIKWTSIKHPELTGASLLFDRNW